MITSGRRVSATFGELQGLYGLDASRRFIMKELVPFVPEAMLPLCHKAKMRRSRKAAATSAAGSIRP
ncbi:hypothetical protein [Teichococcus rhizosphaerae]|uniref:hypothetical protein n=1 Tax=Teichococcus rhizosphaerae TaxID=1335062 RepID=UPI00159BA86A|nr:hypothetical protein [Pseudoroseomonas rhizosphaerae]